MARLFECEFSLVFPMVMLYLIDARVARLPRVPLNLPAHSSSPRRKDRRIYARKLRRKPGLRTATRAAAAPRSWRLAAAVLSLGVLAATVVAVPDGARFQVMVGNVMGYPGTIIEVRVPAAAQPVVLQAWRPVLAHLGRPVAMRYPIARTGGEHEAHAVVPVQVRLQGDRQQVAVARPVDAEMLRAELARLAGLPIEAIDVQQRDVAPWRESGWRPLPGP